MKKIMTIKTALIAALAFLLISTSALAQAPEMMSYQAVIRDNNSKLVSNQKVGMQISILQGTATGTAVYEEKQTPTSNDNGLVSIEIGSGTVVNGNFANIDWTNGPFYIKTETDPSGGSSYSISGTRQLLSVPYALHSNKSQHSETADSALYANVADSIVGGETDPSVPTSTQKGEMQYWNGSKWITVPIGYDNAILTLVKNVPTWVGGNPPVPHVTSTTGKVWMDRNLGANQVATSSTDAAAYGDLYQWGRATDGHEKRTNSSTTSTQSATDTPGNSDFVIDFLDWRSPKNDNLWQGVAGINNPCPAGYRLPTEAELDAERLSWSSNDAAGAFSSPLKLTLAGARGIHGQLRDVGSAGRYWGSTVTGSNSQNLDFDRSNAFMDDNYRMFGEPVRCIKD